MSLDWNITACENYEELTTEENWAVTSSIVLATMSAGMGEITSQNAPEFFARLHAADLWPGLTMETVRRYVGLKTNVSTETEAAWSKRTMKSRLRSELEKAQRQDKRAGLL